MQLFEKNQMRRVSGPGARQKPGFEAYNKPAGGKSAFGRPYNENADFTNSRGRGRGGSGGRGGGRGGFNNNKRSFDDANSGGGAAPTAIPGPTANTPGFQFQKVRFADDNNATAAAVQSMETTAEPGSGGSGKKKMKRDKTEKSEDGAA